MRIPISSVVALSFLLAACVPSAVAPHNGGGHDEVMQGEKTLSVRDESSATETAFSVWDGDEMFSDYGISHTKEMHLVVVRKDLRYFHHRHPVRDADGVWRERFAPVEGGDYWLYADFADSAGNSHTLRFERTFPGEIGETGLVKHPERVVTVEGYRIEFQPVVSQYAVEFSYRITDAAGKPVVLEEYLGALGHSILISPSGEFVHTHPLNTEKSPVFKIPLLAGFYRIFTQFRVDGELITVAFDWER